MYSSVAEFHRAIGQSLVETPTLPATEVRKLRQRLLDEETTELKDATAKGDIVEVADALADICYIACGTTDVYGIRPRHDDVRHAPPIMAPVWPGDELAQRACDDVVRAFEIVRKWEELDLIDGVNVGDGVQHARNIGEALEALVQKCFAAAHVFSIPLRAVFDEVHRSNMSKIGPDGKVLRRPDGKVLKPSTFSPADIAGVLLKHGWSGY